MDGASVGGVPVGVRGDVNRVGVMRGVRMVSVLAGILVAIRGDVSRVGGDVGGVNLAEGVRESSAKVMCRRVGCESLCGRDDAWVVGVL